jgi:prolyl-tRNA synthetase
MESWRDLPILVNQWANIVRWEMRTRLFLRTTEFLWQEGHTAHETSEEAMEEVLRMLDVYVRLAEEWLAMPVLKGVKSPAETFAGAEKTYAIEAMMQDRRALQAGTSHFLAQNFAKAYDMQFQGRGGELEYAWSTSWGVSTRLVGGLIMCHSDDGGLVLPPKLAPVQVVVVPIYRSDERRDEVLAVAREVAKGLNDDGVRTKIDERDHLKPGAKFFEWEKKGVPVRLEIGPRDVDSGKVTAVRRDTGKAGKTELPIAGLARFLGEYLEEIQQGLFDRALENREAHTHDVEGYDGLVEILNGELGFVRARWCESEECEAKVKDETTATIRVIPEDATDDPGPCAVCGADSRLRPVWARAY